MVAEDSLLLQLKALAQRTGVSFSEVVRLALAEFVARHSPKAGEPSFVGAGSSGGKLRLSERSEDLLFDRGRRR